MTTDTETVMTIPQIMAWKRVKERTVHGWIAKGKWVDTGESISGRRKRFKLYRLAVADPVGKETPRWRLFERRCAIAGKEPNDVLALLLSRCNSIGPSRPTPHGDPDFLEAAIHLILNGDEAFINSLFDGGGPPSIETAVAGVIRCAPCVETNGEFPRFADCESFNQSWRLAKTFVGRSLQNGAWRYNRNPYIDAVTDPSSPRVVMRGRWHNGIHDHELRERLYELNKVTSINPDEFLPREEEYHKPFARLLTRLSELLSDSATRAAALDALNKLKWIYFDDGLLVQEGAETFREKAVIEPRSGQWDAINWIRGEMPDDGARLCVETFAVGWASRYQIRISERATWESVNRIFQTSGYSPIADFDPREDIKGEAKWAGSGSEYGFDQIVYYGEHATRSAAMDRGLHHGETPYRRPFKKCITNHVDGHRSDGGVGDDGEALWEWAARLQEPEDEEPNNE